MATQTLEFNAGTGLTISCKLFALGSDTVVATATATEKTNDDNRYAVEFTDVAAGAYRLNGFVSSVGGFANEIYDLTAETATFYPRSETKMRGTDAANTTAPLTSEQTQNAAAAALTAYDPPTRTEATSDKDAVLSAISGAKSTPDKIAVRSSDDTTPVRFAWPTSGETITVERSLNNAAYEAATGTVAFFRTEGTEHWYTLSYNAADRAVGVVRYRLNDGTITRYVTLRVELPTLTETQVRGAIGLATANLDTQIADLPTVAEFEARSLPSADYFVVSDYTAPPTASAIADAVLTESVLDHRNVANSLAKFVWQIRQANLTVDGTVSNAITPTTLTFASNVAATTSAYAHAVLLFITGPLTGENSPIISYNNTNGVFVLEEPLTAAPTSGDEFVVIAGSHVHSVADIQSGLALEATLTDIKGAGFATGTDSLKELRDAVDGIDAGGGDTAEEIVDEIVARGITAIPVQSGVTSSGNLELIQGDTYNGTAKPLLSFPTSANYTDGWTATLTIRDEEDAVIATASGVVVSSTQVTVSFTTPTGLTFTGCPGVWQGKFDVQMSKSTQRATIARGIAYVYEDQTRS